MKFLRAIARWFLFGWRKKAKPKWAYASHVYTGLENACHWYRVTYTKGAETQSKVVGLHAPTPHPKCDKIVMLAFIDSAKKLNNG